MWHMTGPGRLNFHFNMNEADLGQEEMNSSSLAVSGQGVRNAVDRSQGRTGP